MDDDMLAVGTLEGADGLHERAAGAGAVAGASVIDVARVEAERAVVAVVAATGQWADEFVAVAALEALVEGVAFAAPWIAHGRLVQRHAVGAGAALLASGAAHVVVVSVMRGVTLAASTTLVAPVWFASAGRAGWLSGVGCVSVGSIVLVFWHSLFLVYG